ncbi:MAG: carboxypeptidase-like regulatory domain-containing protein [bacterium]
MRSLHLARVALALLVPVVSGAQAMHGVVVDRSDAPVAGVVVILLDNASLGVARALSNDRGEFRLTAPKAGRYRVRTMRIGFLPVTSEPNRRSR